ncbi:zinc finger CCHC domain-containing protein 18-like [Alosa sapidissima]|uniref:zinc finger CCHC domain-containing protein 18-like n=1 Tax=Alosa sapidissima TaxID=34773 RepID=UPI001C08D863|nr:zinc finger CCHC domain-containing protein 18-like [Alosa sapidissima]XP_041913516.1 zinc finger CCHC domain-containing protein 18-like [Alosa sapidissima]
MDVIRSENVKVPNSLLVSGLTGGEEDNEVMEYLGTVGSVQRIIKVTSDESQFKDTAIVEFTSGETIQFLHEALPCKRPSSNPDVIHQIQLLSELYVADKSSSLTQSYLAELQDVAKLSGTNFEKLLLDELAKIQGATKSNPTTELPTTPPPTNNTAQANPLAPETQSPTQIVPDLPYLPERDSLPVTVSAPTSALHRQRTLNLTPEQLTTPEVQKVVVEHVIKNSNLSSQYHDRVKLRPFSGKIPCPGSESDYDTWRNNVEFLLADVTASDKHTVRKMVESLLPPAAHIVKHLGPKASPHDYLSLLDSAYDTVDDGDELFARFLSTNQNSGEKPSSYLQRLQTALSKVVKRGGIAASELERQLLKQFCRGCWNNALITSLQLEQKKLNPPSFSELLLLLRTEEDRQAAKSSRMKQHLGFPKARAQANVHTVQDYDTDTDTATFADSASSTEMHKLEKQIAKLQTQMASLKASMNSSRQATDKQNKKLKTKTKVSTQENFSVETILTKRPRPGYCFKCGEDGHIVPSCSNEPNPELVEKKRRELKQKQQAWDEQNEQHLN